MLNAFVLDCRAGRGTGGRSFGKDSCAPCTASPQSGSLTLSDVMNMYSRGIHS